MAAKLDCVRHTAKALIALCEASSTVVPPTSRRKTTAAASTRAKLQEAVDGLHEMMARCDVPVAKPADALRCALRDAKGNDPVDYDMMRLAAEKAIQQLAEELGV